MSKATKTTKVVISTTNGSYIKIAKNVYMTQPGTYRVQKMTNGKKIDIRFTNKAKAIKYAKSL